MDPILLGFLGSLFAGLATVLGTIPLLFISSISKKTEILSIGFSSGVMLAASFFSLLVPGFEYASNYFEWKLWSIFIVVFGFILGVCFIWWVDQWLTDNPIELFDRNKTENKANSLVKSLWLFIIAIAIHNFPEGMAVGVALGQGDLQFGLPLAIGIGLQNIPEGLIVAISVLALGYSRSKAFMIALFSGLVEPIGGLIGVLLVQLSNYLLPIGLGFAAGVMIFVIIHKMIPELQVKGYHNQSTMGCMIGMIIMMILDVMYS